MDVGLEYKHYNTFISISALVSHLDHAVIDALPALHAYTGSDYTSSFMNKGIVKKNSHSRMHFQRLVKVEIFHQLMQLKLSNSHALSLEWPNYVT